MLMKLPEDVTNNLGSEHILIKGYMVFFYSRGQPQHHGHSPPSLHSANAKIQAVIQHLSKQLTQDDTASPQKWQYFCVKLIIHVFFSNGLKAAAHAILEILPFILAYLRLQLSQVSNYVSAFNHQVIKMVLETFEFLDRPNYLSMLSNN